MPRLNQLQKYSHLQLKIITIKQLQNIKNCILIASLLSILKDPFYFNDVNIKDFICGSNDEITLILDMINIIFQKKASVCPIKLSIFMRFQDRRIF